MSRVGSKERKSHQPVTGGPSEHASECETKRLQGEHCWFAAYSRFAAYRAGHSRQFTRDPSS